MRAFKRSFAPSTGLTVLSVLTGRFRSTICATQEWIFQPPFLLNKARQSFGAPLL
jgi:hypothetical protein